MKKYILMLTIMIIVTNSYAQNCNYEEYYNFYDLAKKNYYEKNYKEAEKNIKLAFRKIEFPMGSGLQLALLIAQKQNDSKWAEQISINLAKGGVPLKFFRYLKKYDWYEKFESDFETYSKYYAENFKPELKEKLKDLIKRDIQYNSKYHDWRTKKIELTLEELIDGASKILTDFNELNSIYGFPYEKITGYNYVESTNTIENFKTDVLIIHIYQRGVLILEDKIEEVICNGGMHPNRRENLKLMRGFGSSTGIEEEMKIRYEKHRK